MINLPVLQLELKGEDLHPLYQGIVITMRLNVAYPPYESPWKDQPEEERVKLQKEQLWETEYWTRRARPFMEILLPGSMTDDKQPLRFTDIGAKELYDLEHRPDFDPAITMWASAVWNDKRNEHIRQALGN
jgi:hypothetical protein